MTTTRNGVAGRDAATRDSVVLIQQRRGGEIPLTRLSPRKSTLIGFRCWQAHASIQRAYVVTTGFIVVRRFQKTHL